MLSLRRNLISINYSRLVISIDRSFCKKKDDKLTAVKSLEPRKQLISPVVIKNPDDDNLTKDKKIDYNIAIKNLDQYEDESQVVYDITDEKLEQDDDESKFKYLFQNRKSKDELLNDPKLTKHGKNGVFDLDQMVYALEKEKIKDIAVIKIPEDLQINKCFVIGSARSPKHLQSVFDYIIKLYKIKKSDDDQFPHCEGKYSKSWKIIDMDIIMLHLFLEEKREFYDIEQLWTVGADYDEKCRNTKDDLEILMEKHTKSLENPVLTNSIVDEQINEPKTEHQNN